MSFFELGFVVVLGDLWRKMEGATRNCLGISKDKKMYGVNALTSRNKFCKQCIKCNDCFCK